MISKIQQCISGITFILLAFLGTWLKGKQSGKQQAEARNNEQILQNAKEVKDVKIEVDVMPDDAVRDELRKQWTND